MIEHILEIIRIVEAICFGILFLVYPYFIFYIFVVSGGDIDDFDWYMWIPLISHFISLLMGVMLLIELFRLSIKRYYKIRYRVNKITRKERKLIDPFDEEDWEEGEWQDKLYNNKFYNKIPELP